MTDLIEITDSHCHLDFDSFDVERDEVVARAVSAGVTRMVTICTKLRAEPQVRALAERYDPVFYAAGTHPMSVADEPMAAVEALVGLAQHPKMVGIGETGLDYHYTSESAEAQQQSLRIHIEAARQTGLPLIIHARDADEDMARILSEEYRNGTYSCVMHCFSSSAALAKAAMDLGFLPVDVRHCGFPEKPGVARYLRDGSGGSHSGGNRCTLPCATAVQGQAQ